MKMKPHEAEAYADEYQRAVKRVACFSQGEYYCVEWLALLLEVLRNVGAYPTITKYSPKVLQRIYRMNLEEHGGVNLN